MYLQAERRTETREKFLPRLKSDWTSPSYGGAVIIAEVRAEEEEGEATTVCCLQNLRDARGIKPLPH